MLAWCGGGDPPGSRKEPPDLVAESAEREEAGRQANQEAFPPGTPWGRHGGDGS